MVQCRHPLGYSGVVTMHSGLPEPSICCGVVSSDAWPHEQVAVANKYFIASAWLLDCCMVSHAVPCYALRFSACSSTGCPARLCRLPLTARAYQTYSCW